MFPEILPFASLIMTDRNVILKERMISISMEQFKKIDRKISLVSGVSKANAVLSALKGGLVDVLILDSNLAEALLKLTQE